MSKAASIRKAQELTARCTGHLALAMGQNKIGRTLLGRIALDLREAAELVEGVRNDSV
jgi:hypothetical protein